MSWLHNITIGVKNLVRWFPVIWKDRDWDHHYCSEILRHKLLLWAEHEERYGHHNGSERDAKRMRICAELLRRVEADNYYEALVDAFVPKPKYWDAAQGCGLSPHGYSMLYPDLSITSQKAFVRLYDQAERQRKFELEYCFKLMTKYYLGWWD